MQQRQFPKSVEFNSLSYQIPYFQVSAKDNSHVEAVFKELAFQALRFK
jgi:hypothetical protein